LLTLIFLYTYYNYNNNNFVLYWIILLIIKKDKLLELGEKSKIIINENTELDSENSNLKKEIQKKDKIFQTKENELKALSNGKDDMYALI